MNSKPPFWPESTWVLHARKKDKMVWLWTNCRCYWFEQGAPFVRCSNIRDWAWYTPFWETYLEVVSRGIFDNKVCAWPSVYLWETLLETWRHFWMCSSSVIAKRSNFRAWWTRKGFSLCSKLFISVDGKWWNVGCSCSAEHELKS